MANEGLMDQAAEVAARKASQVAGGFVGEKAGELAGEAAQKYGPRLKEQWRRGTRAARENPGATTALALVAVAAIGGIAYWLATRD